MTIISSNGFEIEVDEDVYEALNKHRWHVTKSANSSRYYATATISVHRFVQGFPRDKFVDHIDGNGLNNKRDNLRTCDQQQNAINRRVNINNKSGYKGVTFRKDAKNGKVWTAHIRVNKKLYCLGVYADVHEAGKAYAEAAKSLHGEFHNPENNTARAIKGVVRHPQVIPAAAPAALD